MKQSAKTSAANPPATSPALMFLRAVSRSTDGFLSVRAVPRAPGGGQAWAATAIEMNSRAR